MNSVRKIIKKVENTIIRYHMIMQGDIVIVAVSGGPDSVCLLDILYELRDDLEMKLVVAHFDHGFRPGDDKDETEFVQTLAYSLNLPFETKKADQELWKGGGSLEEKARYERYRFLDETKHKFSAQKIALAHNLNDQAETVLMRLLRGSGALGLAGIPPCRDEKLVRPLIEVSREQIELYLEKRQLRYVNDPSNLETSYLRNRIRLDLLPRLRGYQPKIVDLLGQTAGIMRNDEACLEEMTEKRIRRAVEITEKGEIHMPLSFFIRLPEALKNRALRQVLRMLRKSLRRVSLRHIDAIKEMAIGKKPQALVELPDNTTVRKVYDRLMFSRTRDRDAEAFCYFLDGPATFGLDALGCTVSLEETRNVLQGDIKFSRWTAFLNADLITYPLMVRNFRAGDRFVPFGMQGQKKLKDFFMDLKLSSDIRKRIPILTCRNKLIWVCGLRIDDRFKVTEEVKRVLKVSFNFKQQSFIPVEVREDSNTAE